MMRNGVFVFSVFLLLLSGVVSADEVYLNNRLFKGDIQGSGTSLYLELAPAAKRLKLVVTEKDGGFFISNQQLRVDESTGKNMVLLTSLAEAADLKILKNADLGTVDVYRKKAKTASNTSPSPARTPVSSGASTPEQVVEQYFLMIKKVSDQCDFTKDSDFEFYLNAHKPLLMSRSYKEHEAVVRNVQLKEMGELYDDQFAMISSVKAKVLSARVKGDTAMVRTLLLFQGKKEFETFDCKLENGSWKIDPGY